MRERTVIIILFCFFVLIGIGVLFLSNYYSEFNFYKSEISVNGNQITEKLYYKADQSYHTLFRTFSSPVFSYSNLGYSNSVEVMNVICSDGNPYLRDRNGLCTNYENPDKRSVCFSYTENNEYGCTFGSTYGFFEDEEYWIEATYRLHPENIFRINGKDYIKFIIYSKEEHPNLYKNNFVVSGEIVKENSYFFKEDVIVYIPYEDSQENVNIINQEDFEFDNNTYENILLLIISLTPGFIILGVWYFFGRENTYADIPPELSVYPNEREPWKIAAYFNPPFNKLDKNFFSTMLINFYHKKIIDIKIKNKKPWVKINKFSVKLDSIEKDFLSILKKLKHKEIDEGYFNLQKDFRSWENRFSIQMGFNSLQEKVKKEGKNFIDTSGNIMVGLVSFFIFVFFSKISLSAIIAPFLISISFILIMVFIIMSRNSTLLMKFKESYYREYQHWQAFKKYLSNSFSITSGDHRAIAIWNHYLVYATALGVSKKVLKELKKVGIINEHDYIIYTGVYSNAGSFATSSGMSGGGFGGAGGGGVGGGGGGGR